MALTDTKIRSKKPSDKPIKLADDKGLYLLITPTNNRWWRFDYRFDQKRKTLSMGVYPDVTLKEARLKRDEARLMLARGSDPSESRRTARALSSEHAPNSFETLAREWFEKAHEGRAETTRAKNLVFLEKDVFPWIGKVPISEITAPKLLSIIRRIESRGALDIARRVHNLCGRVFRYAVGRGLCERDPSRDLDLRDILPTAHVRHRASITDPKNVGALLRAIDDYTGSHIVRCAMKLAPLVFVRPGELRHAQWSEIDFETGMWRIPAYKMKMRSDHIVPLSSQAVAVLREIEPITGRFPYVFPSERTYERPISENTLNAALRRLGYSKEEMTSHGFRSLASTLLNEQGFPRDAIERQLAHAERNKVRAAYNRAEYLPERSNMMQKWADYLDKLKMGAQIISFAKGV